MECGVASYPAAPPAPPAPAPASHRSPNRSGLRVNFTDKGEVKERREKFLTAKYGSHQMALIRKRLAVEMWLYDELQRLYETGPAGASAGAGAGAAGGEHADVDVDELLDMESDERRRDHLAAVLANARRPPHEVRKFIDELLEKAKTL